jgi:hypothetical protein
MKKSDNDYKEADLKIKELRASYKNTLKNYDFLQDIKEIENADIFNNENN